MMATASSYTDTNESNELTVDYKTDEEVLLNLALQKKLEVSTVIKIKGIPEVTPKSFDKLRIYIIKVFTRFGKILKDYYPKSENGHTKNYLFIEYEDHKSALEAVKWTNTSELDSEYTFLIQLVPDFKRIATLLQPISGYDVHFFLSKPTTYGQYFVNKNLNSRIQGWMNNFPHIPDLEKHRMMADAQLAMAKKKDPKK
ncbi:PREDICTED: eukaryotic translation initiation factor 3 subunit B-like [Diuraphis noxia]|uniref:eukaryotic translation initiation factor 3 subunit B-like n=1 Tax=Diuraphis noxia TaxID=143948 RepID=UPI000763AA84|nr:PREDICTED: eukaryotic translation initiation factor 3 subunit B-like [Diuraphis noxia]XP_015375847.1 PREDICTED: eukaryotic translation initiation factor 3 subunit B-like [Diuraphis noxia]XP_015375848.1 PREDICTED: eukaryotic translation initiation factor 3 subunit B-like [Diuraphis noxia]